MVRHLVTPGMLDEASEAVAVQRMQSSRGQQCMHLRTRRDARSKASAQIVADSIGPNLTNEFMALLTGLMDRTAHQQRSPESQGVNGEERDGTPGRQPNGDGGTRFRGMRVTLSTLGLRGAPPDHHPLSAPDELQRASAGPTEPLLDLMSNASTAPESHDRD